MYFFPANNPRVVVAYLLAFLSCYYYSAQGFSVPSLRSHISPRSTRHYASKSDDEPPNLLDILRTSREDRKRKRDRLREWISSTNSSPMVQSINVDDGSTVEPPARVKSKFESLFAGMPSLSDILGEPSEEVEEEKTRKGKGNDETWFQQERQKIVGRYNEMMQDTLDLLEEQRRDDPDSVPENAEAMIRSVMNQEMEREIQQTKETLQVENMMQLEAELKAMVNEKDLAMEPPSEKVQQLMEQSEKEFRQREALQSQREEFLQYEEDAFRKAAKDSNIDPLAKPSEGQDLDQWVLSRLELIASGKQYEEGGETILDILDANIEDLRERIEKEERSKGSIRPETLKEWQMYRAIATRLTGGSSSGSDYLDSERQFEGQINERLASWKEYVLKEDDFRRQSGLARGPKLPFEWQESSLSQSVSRQEHLSAAEDLQQRIKTRKEINRMSIEALESLLTTSDAQRRDKLQAEIDYLKSTLESNDYLDVDETSLAASIIDQSPVDLRDVFSSQDDDNLYETIPFETPPQKLFFTSEPDQGETLNEKAEEINRKLQPPATPFFTDAADRESLGESTPKVRPPSTPFFMDAGEGEQSYAPSSGVLGSMEDQKLEAMFRRAGARTAEERRLIREQWEDFKATEKEKRDLSGLSGESGDVLTANIKYKLEDVMTSDGDFDADKILATIGKRPERRRKDSDSQNKIDSNTVAQDQKSSINEKEVIDSMFRSVSAVGGGRYRDDPDEYAKQKAYYEEIVNKEKEIRESIQSDDSVDPDLDVTSLDDVEYANQVIASLGPRPKPKRIRILDEGQFSDQGGALAFEQDDDDDDEEEDEIEEDLRNNLQSLESDYPPDMPEWLRREQDEARSRNGRPKNFPGNTIDQVFDDTDYDKNLRQLAEYERRRAGKGRQMGIDISDVLGRSILETDDYADYKFDNDYQRGRQDNWGSVSFASRKADLMEYTELDVAQLNALIDHRDSTYSTGFSQYIPRVNKPFKDFGAIFRLEGVLVDLTGLHLESWTRVAADFGYRVPTVEDVRRASVTRPDIAVKDCLFWTDDFMQCTRVAIAHHKIFSEVFNEWSQQSGVTLPELKFDAQGTQGSLAIGEELVQKQPRSEQRQTVRLAGGETEAIQRFTTAWEKTAQEFGKQIPTYDEVLRSTLLSPDIAVAEVFRWTRNPTEIDAIASKFRLFLSGNSASKSTQQEPRQPQHNRPLSKTEVMEIHFHAWLKVAAAFDFDEPTPDEVAAAFVINDPLIAVRDGFAWSEDRIVINQAVDMFQETIRSLLGQPSKDLEGEKMKASHESESMHNFPSQDEIFRISKEAWTAVSFYLGHGVPDTAQIQFALTVGPEEAITTGFQWTSDPRRAAELVDLYRKELEKRKTWRSESERDNSSTPQSSISQATQKKESGVDQDLIYKVAYDAWVATAFRMGYTAPDPEQVIFALTVGQEDAIRTGFQWTEEADVVNEITKIYKDELATRRQTWAHSVNEIDTAGSSSEANKLPPVTVMDGVRNWVSSLRNVEMPCSVISFLDKDQVDILLEYAGLSDLFELDKRVSMSSGYSRESQQMLGAALRNERRPDHCVVFDTTPHASAAAHEVEMRSVGVIGPYPRYELLSADTTSNSFNELTAMNIRRLFGERVYDQPMMDAQQAEPETRRPTKTKYFWEED